MIINSDEKNEDSPPAYHNLIHPADALPDPPSLKAPFSHLPPTPSTSSRPHSTSSTPSATTPTPWSWWPKATGQQQSEQAQIQQTIQNLLLSLVTSSLSTTAALGILDSCQRACERTSFAFSAALQLRFIQGHSVVYWSIVKRPSQNDNDNVDVVLEIMIKHAQPLLPLSLSELRSACLVSSDHITFHRYLYPLTIPAADKLLLDLQPGTSKWPDEVSVEEKEGSEDEFVVKMQMDEFRRRMGVRGQIAVEFIAKGRLFKLAFSSSPAPSSNGKAAEDGWSISLSIHEGSPFTWLDSRLIIPDCSPVVNEKAKEKVPIILRLKTSSSPLLSPPLHLTSLSDLSWMEMRKEQRLREAQAQEAEQSSLVVGLGNPGLMYAGSSYIAPDGTLRAQLEARLRKPEMDCVIC